MVFSETLAQASKSFRDENTQLISIADDLDYLFDNLYSKKSSDDYHDYLIRLVQSVRRNIILSGFLIEARQLNSGIQVMRTIIESTEILLATLVNFNGVKDVLDQGADDIGKILDKVRKIFLVWKEGKKDLDSDLVNSIIQTQGFKNIINQILTHANPYHNMFIGSGLIGMPDSGYIQSFLDLERDGSPKKDYVLLLLISYQIFLLIYRVSQEIGANNYLYLDEDQVLERLKGKLDLIVKNYGV